MLNQDIFVSLSVQTTIFTTQKFVFVLSMSLNLISLICLFKQTPPNQAAIRNYLILTQIMIILFDMVFELAVEPLVLFPILGGFCCGWLCSIIPLPYVVSLFIIIVCNIGVSIIICVLFRHQATLFDSSPFKLRKRSIKAIRVALLSIFYCPVLVYAFKPIDNNSIESVIDENNLAWVRGRCKYYFEHRSLIVTVVCWAMFVIVITAVTLVLTLFGHIYFVLHHEHSKRSRASVRAIQKSLKVLFIQLLIPLFMISTPACIIFVGLATGDTVSFEVCLTLFYFIFFHSIGHNIILLTVTSTYRTFISDFIRCNMNICHWLCCIRSVTIGISSNLLTSIFNNTVQGPESYLAMVFFLVMVNTTIAAQFNYLFMSIYLLEIFVSFLLLATVPLAVYTLMGMSKFHRNIRLSASSVIIHLALAILARFVLLYYQINRMPMRLSDFVFLTANLVREAVAGWSIAMYEKQSPATLIVFLVQSLILEAYGWTNALLLIYEVYSIQFNVVAYAAVFFGGAVLFQNVLMLNVEYGKRLQKMSIITAYCLSRSYQIRENIKIMQVIRKLAFPALIFSIPAFILISMHIFLPCEERLSLVRNVSIALFDLWIALYAAFFQLLAYNIEPRLQESVRRWFYAAYCLDKYDHVTGRIRKMTRMSSPPHLNETDVYFTMLSKDLQSTKKQSTISKISIIEI